jgi:hypothetical protein
LRRFRTPYYIALSKRPIYFSFLEEAGNINEKKEKKLLRIPKTSLFRPHQIIFSDGQQDKNDIWLIDLHFNDLLLVIHQIGFWFGRNNENYFAEFRTP